MEYSGTAVFITLLGPVGFHFVQKRQLTVFLTFTHPQQYLNQWANSRIWFVICIPSCISGTIVHLLWLFTECLASFISFCWLGKQNHWDCLASFLSTPSQLTPLYFQLFNRRGRILPDLLAERLGLRWIVTRNICSTCAQAHLKMVRFNVLMVSSEENLFYLSCKSRFTGCNHLMVKCCWNWD